MTRRLSRPARLINRRCGTRRPDDTTRAGRLQSVLQSLDIFGVSNVPGHHKRSHGAGMRRLPVAMETIIDEIQAAVKVLGLATDEFRLLPPAEGESVYLASLRHFVSSDRRWWWEDFRKPATTVAFEAGDGWKFMPGIVPNPDESVWFIAEEDQLPFYPVFETTVRIATRIIGECYGFEYYFVSKKFDWLICETHHNKVCAVGVAIEERLKHYGPLNNFEECL